MAGRVAGEWRDEEEKDKGRWRDAEEGKDEETKVIAGLMKMPTGHLQKEDREKKR